MPSVYSVYSVVINLRDGGARNGGFADEGVAGIVARISDPRCPAGTGTEASINLVMRPDVHGYNGLVGYQKGDRDPVAHVDGYGVQVGKPPL